MSDSYFANVSLLLHCDGVNSSNTFIDSGPNNTIIIPNGSVQINTAQSKWGTGSAYFNGTNAYLTVQDSSLLDLPGDFTYECWFYPTSVTGSKIRPLIYPWNSSVKYYLYLYNDKLNIGGNAGRGGTTSIQANTWNHAVLTRSSGSISMWLNGVKESTSISDSSNIQPSYTWIGGSDNSNEKFLGYIDEVRFTNGVARYTNTFTPPTEAFWDINDYYTEIFANTDIYFANVSLLLAGESSNNSTTILDSSNNNITISVFGNTCIRTDQKKYGNSSIYFDGNNDYLTTSSNTVFGFGTGDFTIECWIYYLGDNGYKCFFHNDSGSGNYIYYGLNNGSKKLFVWNNGNVIVTDTDISNNVWQHHAIVRTHGNLYLYLDGILIGQTPWNVDLGSSRQFNISNDTQTPNCYIDNFRITKGISRYSENFSLSLPDEWYTSTYDPYAQVVTLNPETLITTNASGQIITINPETLITTNVSGQIINLSIEALIQSGSASQITLFTETIANTNSEILQTTLFPETIITPNNNAQTISINVEILSPSLAKRKMPNIYFSNTFGDLITSTYNIIEELNSFGLSDYDKKYGTLQLKNINVIGESEFETITYNNLYVANSIIISGNNLIIGTEETNNTTILVSGNSLSNGAISIENIVKSSVIDYTCYLSNVLVTNTSHTLENLTQYRCDLPQAENVNTNRAFHIPSSFNISTNDYGYYTNIPENNNNWNLYISGTASNYIRGNLGLNTTDPQKKLQLIGNQIIQANSSLSTLKIKHTGSGNVLNILQNENIIPSIINSKGTVVIGDSIAKAYSLPFYNSRSNYQYKLQITANTEYNATAAIAYFGNETEKYTTPSLSFNRSGSTITNTHKLVINPQVLGSIGFAGNDGTTFLMSSGIRSELDNIASANCMPAKLIFSTTLTGTKVSADRFTISSNGNIAINVVPENWKVLSIRTGLSGNSNSNVIELNSEIQANVSNTYMMYMKPSVQNTTFTLSNLRYYSAAQSIYGALATVINQYGFYCGNLCSANNNYGFYSNISGNTNYNIYSEGTAPNYFSGDIRMEKTIL